jgi:mannosyl-3-phosphoglycerate phosphatase
MNLLVFTDLDDTLLDHDNYSYESASSVLELFRRQQIPLIFNTSKTRLEIEQLQAEMQIKEPFIVENGGGIFFPDHYRNFKIDTGFRQPPYTIIQLGVTYSEIRRFVYSIKGRFNLKGFYKLRVEEIEHLTGLSREETLMAKQREFSEPFLIEDRSKLGELNLIAESRGIKITSDGRFFHFIGIRQDKGLAARLCADIFFRNIDKKIMTVELGDSVNDRSMLKSVDIPILIPRFDGSYAEIDQHNLIKADYSGSRGWNKAMMDVLSSLDEWKRR